MNDEYGFELVKNMHLLTKSTIFKSKKGLINLIWQICTIHQIHQSTKSDHSGDGEISFNLFAQYVPHLNAV